MSTGTQQIPRIIEDVFRKDNKVIGERITELMADNHALGGSSYGFLFEGEFTTTLDKKMARRMTKSVLAPELHDKGKLIFGERRKIREEETRLTQALHLLLRDCHTLQDIRDALPNLDAQVMPELRTIKRTRPAGWPFKDKPLLEPTFTMIEDILNFYAANQLLY